MLRIGEYVDAGDPRERQQLEERRCRAAFRRPDLENGDLTVPEREQDLRPSLGVIEFLAHDAHPSPIDLLASRRRPADTLWSNSARYGTPSPPDGSRPAMLH